MPKGCPCGFFGDKQKECHCSLLKIQKCLGKISGPLFDRIDIHIEVRRIPYKELKDNSNIESSVTIRQRVNAVRLLQAERFKNFSTIHFNAHMGPREIKSFCPMSTDAQKFLELAIKELALSARAYHKILKIARTIRDIKTVQEIDANSQKLNCLIERDDISEALNYRSSDRNWWG